MLVISLHQPWATLMALGEKLYETRAWPTDIRGPVVVYAAKKSSIELRQVFHSDSVYEVLYRAGYKQWADLPQGALVSLHDLDGCFNSDKAKSLILTDRRWNEIAFGDYKPGRFAFHMPLIKKFDPPIPFRYSLGGPRKFFQIDDDLIKGDKA